MDRLRETARWLVAAALVFQVSAAIGSGVNPPETVTAVSVKDAGAPLRTP